MSLVKCKSCGNEVSSDAKTCPKCGKPQKMGLGKKLLIGIAVLFVLGIIGNIGGKDKRTSSTASVTKTSAAASAAPANTPPQPWDEFTATLVGLKERYSAAQNEIKKSEVFREARAFDKSFFGKAGNSINEWKGWIDDLSTDKGGGKLNLRVKVGERGFGFSTSFGQGYSLEETMGNGGIASGSPVYQAAADMKEGQCVLFSGKVQPKEGSTSEAGAMDAPEYRIVFTDLKSCE